MSTTTATTTTTTTTTAPERATLDALIALGPETLATAILRASTVAGALPEWDSETIEWVLGALHGPVSEAIPHAGDNTEYYTPIALALGIYSRDDLGIEEDPRECSRCGDELDHYDECDTCNDAGRH